MVGGDGVCVRCSAGLRSGFRRGSAKQSEVDLFLGGRFFWRLVAVLFDLCLYFFFLLLVSLFFFSPTVTRVAAA